MIVSSGKAAIDYLSGTGDFADRRQSPLPCLVLLDLKMPGISGLDVLKWIRATPSVSTLAVIMLTLFNQDPDIQRAYMQGANGYVVKLIRTEEMITTAKAIKDFWLVQNRVSTWMEVTLDPLPASDSTVRDSQRA